MTQCESLYLSNEGNQASIIQLSAINDELIQSIDLEKKAKEAVRSSYDQEFKRIKGERDVARVLMSIEVERLHQMVEQLRFKIKHMQNLELAIIPEEAECDLDK